MAHSILSIQLQSFQNENFPIKMWKVRCSKVRYFDANNWSNVAPRTIENCFWQQHLFWLLLFSSIYLLWTTCKGLIDSELKFLFSRKQCREKEGSEGRGALNWSTIKSVEQRLSVGALNTTARINYCKWLLVTLIGQTSSLPSNDKFKTARSPSLET